MIVKVNGFRNFSEGVMMDGETNKRQHVGRAGKAMIT
jgi:hypothetical protein